MYAPARRTRIRRKALLSACAALATCAGLAACSGGGDEAPASSFSRTEEREPCDSYDPQRQPFFGDLHVHTMYSADARIFGTQNDPRDAYRFARGEEIAISDEQEQPTRRVRIDRPLDFAAVTDHSEFLGEVGICTDPDSPAYDDEICELLRSVEEPSDRFLITVNWLFPAGISNPPPSLPFCDELGLDCDASAVSVWALTRDAAEEAYDRSSACQFTSFIGYEHTASPLGQHLHRNVIFRNERVPVVPSSVLETERRGHPQGLWEAIEDRCLNDGSGCDAVIIPHNSNLSAGRQFVDPLDAADARRRREREPLVEIYQHKGGSECRFDRLAGRGVATEDELCTFEQLENADETPKPPGTLPPTVDEYPARNLVRNVLKDGLVFEETLGENPFQMGFIGSTDTHDATAGAVAENLWPGAQGNGDATPARRVGRNLRENPGGLAVVWAEENSRDAIFEALRRRETYATSGTRPVVRFFGGELGRIACGRGDFVEAAYRDGVPMGGVLGAASESPRFAVLAFKDPGTAESPGTDLDRIQIVKGWVDAAGAAHEAVYDVASAAAPGAPVDGASCTPSAGASELCVVWEDPTFDPDERAFYYARVLERQSCRWSTLLCREAGVDPFSSECASQAAAAGELYDACCTETSAASFYDPTIQERAWTSPIWYRPG